MISPNIWYRDVNDIPDDVRIWVKKFFKNDEEYSQIRFTDLPKGKVIERQYCLYVLKDGDILGNLVCKEALDSPYGYKRDDFYYTKRIFPKFRRTKYSRYASGDFIHMAFKSGLAKHLYSVMKVRPGVTGETLWEIADFTMPCLGIVFDTDGPNVQKYMSIKKRIGDFIIVDFSGVIYNAMDLKEYFLAPGNRTEEMAECWIREMDMAAEVVRGCIAS